SIILSPFLKASPPPPPPPPPTPPPPCLRRRRAAPPGYRRRHRRGGGAAAVAALSNRAYADGPFSFLTPTPSPPPTSAAPAKAGAEPHASADSSSGGFDAESLERAASALRKINSSPHAKQVFEVMRKQEETRLEELAAEKAQFLANRALAEIETQRKLAEEQRNIVQQQAQAKAQMARYEDELARKRMQTEHEAQRRQNAELVRMQEESAVRKEQARRATEEQIQAQQRQTEKERAEIERETIRVKAMAEAEGRAHEAKLTEEHNKRMLLERMHGEREKWIAAINATFNHIEGGVRTLMTDRTKLAMAVGGVTALAAGSSMAKFPFSGLISRITKKSLASSSGAASESGSSFENIILHPSLKRRIEQLARATANTKSHDAPFRNMLFYGPPGTGKTLVAREMARKSGLDYAMMTGGDVAPLGSQAVTKIHDIFDWAKKSKNGLLLFIDEADAFLCERNSTYMSEAQRSALNALLFRTGDQSRDIILVLATNRPGDLDAAVTDRIDEVIEFPLPGEEERFKLLKLYLNKYMLQENNSNESSPPWRSLFKRQPQKIVIKDISDEVLLEAAKKTEGFSGREIAKLMASVQAAVYGRPDCVLDSQLFREVVDYKVAEHYQRIKLSNEGAGNIAGEKEDASASGGS
ncbi:ATPase family AAA domain-containing protein 3, partial [Ananas comosus]